jgi:O-acetyl-ADP-ribose deacetylase (regulator of RNase III)
MHRLRIANTWLELRQGDITQVAVDAIVNAANSALAGGGGVDGAIHRAGGPSILAECRRIGGCPTGSAVLTGAGNLPAQHVIHAVAPIYSGRHESHDSHLLRSAYATSLRLAESVGATSVAFPSLGTGAYHYPIHLAAPLALGAVADHLWAGSGLVRVLFVLFTDHTYDVYAKVLDQMAATEGE